MQPCVLNNPTSWVPNAMHCCGATSLIQAPPHTHTQQHRIMQVAPSQRQVTSPFKSITWPRAWPDTSTTKVHTSKLRVPLLHQRVPADIDIRCRNCRRRPTGEQQGCTDAVTFNKSQSCAAWGVMYVCYHVHHHPDPPVYHQPIHSAAGISYLRGVRLSLSMACSTGDAATMLVCAQPLIKA